MVTYLEFGAPAASDGTAPPTEVLAALLAACASNRAFKVLDRRYWDAPATGPCDVLVVDCTNDQIPTRNAAKVMVRERLALVLPRDTSKAPEVRALRESFPPLMHLNSVPNGEPASLCLYFEPWATARRTWTAEKFLQRILFWLTGAAQGTLHRRDQPLEPMYFESPIDVVLPPDYAQRANLPGGITLLASVQRDQSRCTLRAMTRPEAELPAAARVGAAGTVLISFSIDPVVHGGVEALPLTLGQLADGIASRGADLRTPLRKVVAQMVGSTGAASVQKQSCLLLVSIPTKRALDAEAERTDTRGFYVQCDLRTLGVALGALSPVDSGGKHYPATILGGGDLDAPSGDPWCGFGIVPVAVRYTNTRRFARQASSVCEEAAEDRRILAGVGALGSCLADLWSRAGWGAWTVVDPDYVLPHNVLRHVARDRHIGFYKVDVVKDAIDSTYGSDCARVVAIHNDILETTDARIQEEMTKAALLVDATTTLHVPRELSCREGIPRCVSVFLSPSGRSGVMLLEDSKRAIRLDELEAQYYGAILSSTWGSDHLAGHAGELWVGAGCRDVSVVLSNELVQLHASILARQVRRLSAGDAPRMRVWVLNEDTSEVQSVEPPVRWPIRVTCGMWTVVSHEGVSEKLAALRASRLPTETGGVVVGYVDQPLKRVFIVDVLPAPRDSKGTESGFVRGVDGLEAELEAIGGRTAGIVGYIGEWHSHPPFAAPDPSGDDIGLLAHCARTLARDGVPALMLIVGRSGEISYAVAGREGTMTRGVFA